MLSPFIKFFRGRHEDCDCCDHNINIAALLEEEDETRERQTMKKRLQKFLASLKWKRTKKLNQKRPAATKKSGGWRFKQLYRRVRHMGKMRSFGVRRKQTREITNAVADAYERGGK